MTLSTTATAMAWLCVDIHVTVDVSGAVDGDVHGAVYGAVDFNNGGLALWCALCLGLSLCLGLWL